METVTAIDGILVGGKRLHGLVNNAGICIKGELDWLNAKQADTMMKVSQNELKVLKFQTKFLILSRETQGYFIIP